MASNTFRQGSLYSDESFLMSSLPINKFNNMPSLASRLRNPTLYIFPEERQTLVSLAETIATKTLLNTMEIPFTEIPRYNTDYMSPNFQVPLLVQDTLLAGGYEKILGIVSSVHPNLVTTDPDITACANLITDVVMPTMDYCQFLTGETIRAGTDIVSIKLPFPINFIVPFQTQLSLRIKYYRESERDVYKALDRAFFSLDNLTGKYPEGDMHLASRCRLYGYLYAIINEFKEGGKVRTLLHGYKELNKFYERMSQLKLNC